MPRTRARARRRRRGARRRLGAARRGRRGDGLEPDRRRRASGWPRSSGSRRRARPGPAELLVNATSVGLRPRRLARGRSRSVDAAWWSTSSTATSRRRSRAGPRSAARASSTGSRCWSARAPAASRSGPAARPRSTPCAAPSSKPRLVHPPRSKRAADACRYARAMAVSRPFLLALLGVALLGATFFAVNERPEQRCPTDRALRAPEKPAEQAAPAPAPTGAAGPEQLLPRRPSPPASRRERQLHIRLNAQRFSVAGASKSAVQPAGAFEDTAEGMPELRLTVSGGAPDGKLNEHGQSSPPTGKGAFRQRRHRLRVPQELWAGRQGFRSAIAKAASDPAAGGAEPDLNPEDWLKDIKARARSQGRRRRRPTHISATSTRLAAADMRQFAKAVAAISAGRPSRFRRASAQGRARLEERPAGRLGRDDHILRRLRHRRAGKFPRRCSTGETPRHVSLDRPQRGQRAAERRARQDLGRARREAPDGVKDAKSAAGVLTLGAVGVDPPASIARLTSAPPADATRTREAAPPRAPSPAQAAS